MNSAASRAPSPNTKQRDPNGAKGIGELKGAFEDLDKQRIAANERFKTDLAALDKATKKQIESIKAEQAALEELTAAREKSELAGAKTPEERSAISQRYSAFRRSASEGFAAREIAAREAGVGALNQQMTAEAQRAMGLSGGLNPQQVSAHLANLPALRKSLDELIEAKKKEIQDLEPGYWMTLGLMGRGATGADEMRAIDQAIANSRATLGKLQQTRAFYGTDFEKRLLGAQVADANVFSLQSRIGTENEAIGDLRNAFGGRRGLNLQLSAITAGQDAQGQMLLSAADGADAILGGGRATAAQSAAINQANRLLGLQDQSSQVLLQVLARINDREEWLINAMKEMDMRLKNQAQRQ